MFRPWLGFGIHTGLCLADDEQGFHDWGGLGGHGGHVVLPSGLDVMLPSELVMLPSELDVMEEPVDARAGLTHALFSRLHPLAFGTLLVLLGLSDNTPCQCGQ